MFFFVNCLYLNEDLTIQVTGIKTTPIGKKGTALLEMNKVSQFAIDTSREIKFQAKVSGGQVTKNVGCGIWKATTDKNYIFCDIDDTFAKGSYTLDLSNVQKFDYQNYKVSIIQTGKKTFEKVDKDMLDLYSEQQKITVNNNDSYDIKFKIISYHQEVLRTDNFIINCDQNNNELVYHFPKNDIEKYLKGENAEMPIYYISDSSSQTELPLIPNIIVTDYTISRKIDVNILITKLVENIAEDQNLIAYETNITDISSVYADLDGNLLEFMNEAGKTNKNKCYLRKYDNFPLYVVCEVQYDGISWLKEITEEKIYIGKNVKYTFKILPVKNEERINYQHFRSCGRGPALIVIILRY